MTGSGTMTLRLTNTVQLESVPRHWQTVPFWVAFRRRGRTEHDSSEELLSVYRDHGVVPREGREDNFNKPSEDLSRYQLVQPGDLVINKMKAWQGSVAVSEYTGLVSPAYFVYESLHTEHPRYLHYLLRSDAYVAAYGAVSKGIRVGQWDLDPQEHSRLQLILPPLDEQDSIVGFLDFETARIDALIAEQQRLIELLKEKRQAVISQAVTKGLDPSVPMKDSGVEWLGEVPAHWEVVPVRVTVDEQNRKNASETGDYLSLLADVGVIPYEEKGDIGNKKPVDLSNSKVVEVGDFVINSMNFGIGSFGVSAYSGVCSPVYIVLRPRIDVVDSDFLAAVFANRLFQSMAQSFGNGILAHRAAINSHVINRLKVPLPPIDEQRIIAASLATDLAYMERLQEQALDNVKLLQERRAAVISAAVTGKIDVRNWQPPATDFASESAGELVHG